MIVVLTDEAKADLERIGDFIAADNPRRAETFVVELLDRCSRLAEIVLIRWCPVTSKPVFVAVPMKTTLFLSCYRNTG